MKYQAHKVITGIARYTYLLVAAALWSSFLVNATFFLVGLGEGQGAIPLDFVSPLVMLVAAVLMLLAFVSSRSGKPVAALATALAALAAVVTYWVLINLSWSLKYPGQFELALPVIQYFEYLSSIFEFLVANPLVFQWWVFIILLDFGSWLAPLAVLLAIAALATRDSDKSSVGPLATSRYRFLPVLALVGVGLQSLALVLITANIDSVLSLGYSFEDVSGSFTDPEWLLGLGLALLALGLAAAGQAGVNAWIAGLVASYARGKGYSWALFFWLSWLAAGPGLMLIIAIALRPKSVVTENEKSSASKTLPA